MLGARYLKAAVNCLHIGAWKTRLNSHFTNALVLFFLRKDNLQNRRAERKLFEKGGNRSRICEQLGQTRARASPIESCGGKRRLRLKYGSKPFILLSVLYPGIYLQTAGNSLPRRAREIQSCIDKHIFRFCIREKICATGYKKKNLIKYLAIREVRPNDGADSIDRKWIYPRFRWRNNRKNHKLEIWFSRPCRCILILTIIRAQLKLVIVLARRNFKLLSRQRSVTATTTDKLNYAHSQRIKLQVKSAGFAVAAIICRFHGGTLGVYDARKMSGDNSVRRWAKKRTRDKWVFTINGNDALPPDAFL